MPSRRKAPAGNRGCTKPSSAPQSAWPGKAPENKAREFICANAAAGGAYLSYDPAGRLGALVVSGLETRFLYDGAQLAAEANASGVIVRRYFLRAP